MVEVGDPGMQTQEFLSTFPSPEPFLGSLLSSCGSVFLLDDVVALGRGDDLLVVDVRQTRDLPDGRPVAAELIRVNDLWDVVFTQQPGEEGLRGFGITVPLEEDIEHEAVLVYSAPEPMSNAIDARRDLIQMPPGTPTGFPVTKFIGEQRPEFETPLSEGLVTDLNAALVKQFLNITVAERKAVVQPDGVPDDGHRESVAVGPGIGHGGSA